MADGVRAHHNTCDGWGTPPPTPDWLEGRAEVNWSTSRRGYRIHVQTADGKWITAEPGDWIIIDHNSGLHVATDAEHGKVMERLAQDAGGAP